MPVLIAAAVAGGLATAALPPAPWVRRPAISATRGDARLVAREWRRAENRRTCAPFAFNSVRQKGVGAARARRAVFAGGWAIAYDTRLRRSAFGIAGAGVAASNGDIARWPSVIRWRDGSAAGYGLVGDTGPGYIAYVKIRGQKCLYNVWSDVSRRHLRQLIAQMRRVRT